MRREGPAVNVGNKKGGKKYYKMSCEDNLGLVVDDTIRY
jgi:hypothetical protein